MLHEADIRAMVRLIGEVSESDDDLSQKRRSLLSQLCELIDADTWTWALNRQPSPQKTALCLENMTGGRNASALPPVLPDLQLAASLALKANPTSNPTLTYRQITDDVVSAISLSRHNGRPPFNPRQLKMAQIILSEIPWLHDRHFAAEKVPLRKGLPPRQQATLIHWVGGLGCKAIADRLRISPHTVRGYIKEIYKHYGVNGRPELIRQFTMGWKQGTNDETGKIT